MGRTTMDPGPGNNGRGAGYNYGRGQDPAGSVRYAPGPESVRSHPPVDGSRNSYGGSTRGSYYPPESHRSYPPPPESHRSYPPPPQSHHSYHPSESQRSYHPPAESQKSFPLESHRSYPVGPVGPDSRASLYDKIVLAEMLLGSLFGIFGVATMNWRATGANIFNSEQESYWVAVRALTVMSILMMIISLVIEIIIVVQKNLRKKAVLWISFAAQILAVISMLVSCGVFGHHECGGREGSSMSAKGVGTFKNNCGYSYWFAVIGCVFSAQGLIFHFFAMRTKY